MMSERLLPTSPDGARWVVLVLRVLLAAFFLLMAGRNLLGDATMVADFQRWGYSDGFRTFTALIQIVGALALLLPWTSFYGAALLGGVLLGAIATHLRHDPPMTALSPATFLVLVGFVAIVTRPHLLR